MCEPLWLRVGWGCGPGWWVAVRGRRWRAAGFHRFIYNCLFIQFFCANWLSCHWFCGMVVFNVYRSGLFIRLVFEAYIALGIDQCAH